MSNTNTQHTSSQTSRNDCIPLVLREQATWARWIKGTRDKMPANLDNTAMTWGTVENRLSFEQVARFDKIGWFVDPVLGIIVIDFDGCRDRETGIIHPLVQKWIADSGSYAEISQSRTGVKLYLLGTVPGNKPIVTTNVPWRTSPDQEHIGIEIYAEKHFIAMTGNILPGCPSEIVEAHEVRLDMLVRFAPAPKTRKKNDTSESGDFYDSFVRKHLEVMESVSDGDIIVCPWADEHSTPGDTARIWKGPPHTFHCFHAHCANRLWRDVRLHFEPHAYDKVWEMPHYRAEPGASSNGNGTGNHQQPTDEQQGSFKRTDLGNAERFAAHYRDRVRWCQVWNTWLVFNGRAWEQDKTNRIDRLAKDTVRSIYNEAADEPDDKLRAIIVKHAVSSESNRAVRAMLERAKSELPAVPEDFNTHLHLLNCKNGTLDLRTRELRPHNSKDMLTRCLDIGYNPLAECPLWLSVLHTILGKKEPLIEFVKQALGMSLSGDISEQCWFLCHGEGNNGKSTLLETVGAILSAYALSAKIESFQAKKADRANYDQAEFYGARLITAAENQQGTRLNEAFMKKITGGEKIRAEHKYGREFEFMPECTIWLSVNHKPVIKDMSKGMWRRVHYIPFLVTIADSQIDPKLRDKLLTEAEGILAWLVQGCLSWYKQGRLTVPEEVKAATQSYREEQDTVSRFLSEECRFVKKAKVAVKALNTRYEEWCDQNGEKYSAKDLKAELNRRGLQAKKSHGAWLYEDIELAPTTENPPDGDEGDVGDVGDVKNENFSRKEKDSPTLGDSTSPTSPTSPFEHDFGGKNHDAPEKGDVNTDGTEYKIAKKSPFEMPKASVEQMRKTIRTWAQSKGWPRHIVHDNYSVGPTETLWNEFLSKPGFYGIEWQIVYKRICEYNAMYPQRGKK